MRKCMPMLAAACILLAACAGRRLELGLPASSGGQAIGSIVLIESGGRTSIELRLDRARPEADYRVWLNAGREGVIGASTEAVIALRTDARGQGRAKGYVRYRGIEDLRMEEIADGEHLFRLSTEGHEDLIPIPPLR